MAEPLHPFESTEIVAHRAGNQIVAAVDAASDPRYIVEADVHVYRGRVEVRHAKVLRPTRRMWDGRHLLPAGTRGVPFDEILEAVGPRTMLMVDLKCFTRSAARRVLSSLPEGQPIVAVTRSWWILDVFEGRPETRIIWSCGNKAQLWFAMRFGRSMSTEGFAVHERRLDDRVAQALRSVRPILFSWGATTRARCVELVGLGVTGLILDTPRILDAAPDG